MRNIEVPRQTRERGKEERKRELRRFPSGELLLWYPEPLDREPWGTERTWGQSDSSFSYSRERGKDPLLFLCHLSSSLPPERVQFHKHCLSTDHVLGSKLEKQKKTLHATFWPKLINSSHLLQGQLNEDKLKGKLRSLENQLYTCTQVSILEDTSSPEIQNWRRMPEPRSYSLEMIPDRDECTHFYSLGSSFAIFTLVPNPPSSPFSWWSFLCTLRRNPSIKDFASCRGI